MTTEYSKSKFDLTRSIPEQVKRLVRQASGFGCVVCGHAICQYEHVDPVFSEARSHDAASITLLCASCHDNVTRGLWSKEKIKVAMQTPRCNEKGFSFGAFDIQGFPEVSIAHVNAFETPVILRVLGDPLIWVAPPEQPKAPFRLSARFSDPGGRVMLAILDNEWLVYTSNWDVETIGPRIRIRGGPRRILLILRVEPPKRLVVERLDTWHRGRRLFIDEATSRVVLGQSEISDLTINIRGRRNAISVETNGVVIG